MNIGQNSYLPDLTKFFIERKSGGIRSLAQMLPVQICPHLLHTLIPYVITLSRGGIFTWMMSDDPNSVIAQCPNPNSAVSCRLVRKNAGGDISLSANIESVKENCPFSHFKGQKINLARYEVCEEYYQIFDAAFPWILYGNVVKNSFRIPLGRPLSDNNKNETFYLSYEDGKEDISSGLSACSPNGEIEVGLNKCARRCRYHKFPWRDNYNFELLGPDGLCPDLLHVAYPWCLAKLYESTPEIKNGTEPYVINCPNAGINVQSIVRKKPMLSSVLRIKIMELMRKFGKNIELPPYRISIDIIKGSDKCPRGHRNVRHFELNLGFRRSMCPAAFDAVYPFLHSLLRGISIQKAVPNAFGGPFIQCPDAVSKNTYKLCIKSCQSSKKAG